MQGQLMNIYAELAEDIKHILQLKRILVRPWLSGLTKVLDSFKLKCLSP
jgi:hypothetical protein